MGLTLHPPCVDGASFGSIQAALQASPEPSHHGDLSFAAGRLVKAALSGRRLQEAPCVLHRLVTTCGKRPVPRTKQGASPVSRAKACASPVRRLVDGRHLGCLRIPVLFAEHRVKRPSAKDRVGTAQADRCDPCRACPWVSRKRGTRRRTRPAGLARAGLQRPHGPDVLAFIREGRARATGSSVASRSASAGEHLLHRSLQPVQPRFRDERCPSGSGWGEAPSSDPAFTWGPSAAQAVRKDARRRAACLLGP